MAIEINKEMIKAELEELAGGMKVKVKLNGSSDAASNIRVTDNTFSLTLNPKRIRTQEKLDLLIADAKQELYFGGEL